MTAPDDPREMAAFSVACALTAITGALTLALFGDVGHGVVLAIVAAGFVWLAELELRSATEAEEYVQAAHAETVVPYDGGEAA